MRPWWTLLKTFSQKCQEVILQSDEKYTTVNLYFQDESRFGLFSRNGKALTAKGIKPICPFLQIFKTVYLFGAFSLINGEKFLLEVPNCNTDNFQIFLNELSLQNPTEFKIMVLDMELSTNPNP